MAPPAKLVAVVAVEAVPAVVAVAALPPIDNPEAVPVMLVPTKVVGVPKFGVTNVGEVSNTTFPVPVVPLVICEPAIAMFVSAKAVN